MNAPSPCARCGRPWVPLEDLTASAACQAVLADRVKLGLETMRLAIPQRVANAVRELSTTTAQLAESLACHAGLCTRREAVDQP